MRKLRRVRREKVQKCVSVLNGVPAVQGGRPKWIFLLFPPGQSTSPSRLRCYQGQCVIATAPLLLAALGTWGSLTFRGSQVYARVVR